MTSKELNYFYRYNISRSAHFLNFRQINSNRISSLICLALYGLIILFPIFYIINKILPRKSFSGKIAFVLTKNQKKVALLLQENFGYHIHDLSSADSMEKINSFFSFLADIHLFGLIREINKHELLKSNPINVIKTIGLYNNVRRYNTRNVTFYYQFNDHSPINFGFEYLFRSRKIKTAYIQHAPVSKEFPSLYHSINFLFSEDSKRKYQISNKCEDVKIICDPRFAFHEAYLDHPIEKNVLLCPNLLDDKSQVLLTADALNALDFTVLIRKHPGDKSQWPDLYLYSQNQSIWADLAKNYCVVTNESAVPLEAIYNGNLCYKSAFWSKPFDAYGFIKSSLIIKEYKSLSSLLQGITLKEVSFDSSKLTYYIGEPERLKRI
jgi:hypothetical protein